VVVVVVVDMMNGSDCYRRMRMVEGRLTRGKYQETAGEEKRIVYRLVHSRDWRPGEVRSGLPRATSGISFSYELAFVNRHDTSTRNQERA